MSVIGVRIALVLGAFLMVGLALPPAGYAQWQPFGDNSFSGPSGPRQGRANRANRPPPPTSQQLLISRATDQAMGQAILQYEQIVAAGGWPAIPAGPKLKFGSNGKRVALLRKRLQASGDYAGTNRRSAGFDRGVHDAVVRFQTRHGLTPSGEVNRFTLKALNVSAKHRLHQLRLNRQRLRRMLARTKGKKYILVNIPGYELQAVSGGQVKVSSRVVVGKPATPTPEVSAGVRAVNFLPYWHVPQSIARRALIPAVKKNPQYLTKEHIRVYASWGGAEVNPAQVNWFAPQGKRYVFRQDPGPHNALGLIRLDMPNRHIVYMHDTPLKKLFRFHLRPYSAGCVRVERVQDVAAWLMKSQPARVAQMTQSGQPQTVKLARSVPVHFMYLSAWASNGGTANFRIDIYDKDGTAASAARLAKWDSGSRSIAP
ncbi:MAG: L,D-transpeptidase family protein [Hyphomicrobiaceae bacterium]|nr:L,D-transpeptidase family protein [Hyphomicrobiaceae bacterium]